MARIFFVAVLFFCGYGFAAAESAVAAGAGDGDVAAGKVLYDEQCLVCHGAGGASVIPQNPILSGQHVEYLRQQTAAYRDGNRKNAVMLGMVSGLSDQSIADIAHYLARQTRVITGAADMDSAKLGERLYRGGSLERGVPSCAACHGPAGDGIAVLAPRLAGQHADYTAAALKAYASGARENAPMNVIAQRLTDEEINQLAEFLSGLAAGN